MPDPRVLRILDELRASGFAELTGARVSARVPIPERLLNEVIRATLPERLPIRDVSVRPQPDNRLSVRARAGRGDFLPPFTVTVQIERQPVMPEGVLVLRILSLPGLMALAGGVLSKSAVLPVGVRLEKDRVFIDVPAVLERAGHADLLRHLESVHVTSDGERLLVDLTAAVR